ncbi:MAG: S8 family serine peptidase [Candidatus Thalassarchaeaceae archaeon]|nr:S8 family serine peptidase [Candidatus Thalassarchaeaceae archaeon]
MIPNGMHLSTAAGRAITIFVIMLLTPWSATLTNNTQDMQNTVLISDNIEQENLFPVDAILLPPSSEWWQRGEELVSVYVITRDLSSLTDWQRINGFEKKQAPASNAQILVSLPQSSGEVEHRRLSLPAQVVPKLLGVSGVMSIFEDPGAPEAFAIPTPTPSSVRTGELHGATDAWLDGVNGSGVKVAIVDSGIDFAHPDLNGTQARVDDANNSYDGWPIMWDPRSVDIWLKDGDAYPANGGSWYSDTSNLDNDSNSDDILDSTGFNISGINPSLSGTYHHGLHPDSKLVSKVGGEVDVLVVDDITQGVYETVYVDIDRDGNFSDEIAMRRGNETAGLDTDSDGLWDISAGLLYWVSDGVNGVPYGAPYSSRAGFQNRIAGAGNLTLFMINDRNDPGGNHGTLCASAVAAQAAVNNGKVKGMAPNSELISVADFYAGGSFLDAWRFLAEGYDGQTGSGDEAQIGSFSFGWSNVHNDGTDQMSMYLDWLTRVHSPETSFLVAMGNGGHGYGTAVSPGGAHGIISVGAFSSQIGQSHGGTWGDSSSWSNRGPNAVSRLDPDIVAVGWSATGDVTLNEVNNANSATTTWAGTSLATPVAAGLVALIYDAWMQEHGVWPDYQTVRDLLMSTADDRGYDPLVQGAGWFNVSRAVKAILGENGSAWVTPASWMAGANHGVHREANANILLPGQTSWANFTVNGTGDEPVNLTWDGATMQPTVHHSQIWNSSTSLGWDGYQGDRPDILIPVHIKGDANYTLPNGTSLIRARAVLAGSGFDDNQDLAEENQVYVELMRWHDDDGDGKWWTDTNNNSLVDSGEMESSSEYSMVSKHSYTSGQVEARLGLPTEREGDGILIGVYRKNIRTNLMDPIPIEIDWTGFGPDSNSSWLSPCLGNGTIPANGTLYVNCRVSVPMNAIPGLRQEQVRFHFDSNNSSYKWSLPVIVNVASSGPINLIPKPLDGNLTNQSLYSETWLQGAQRWGWRSESGDWKFLTFDWPYNLSGDGAIVIDVDWPDNSLTDVDVHWMSEYGHPYSLEDPMAYGQYNLVPEVSSKNMDAGSGKYGWQTSTGGSHEVLVAEATSGMKQMMLHSAMHGVNTNDNPLNISVGLVNSINGTLSKDVVDWSDAEGEEILTIGGTLPLDVSSVEGFGWTQPILLPSETATQDTPGDWASSGYVHQFEVQDAEMLRIEIDSLAPRTDLDLALYRDKNGNGIINWGSEQVVTSGNWNADEDAKIEAPDDGTWWAVVHGYDVPNGSASFWLRQTIIAGDALSVDNITPLNNSEIIHRFPNGSSALGGYLPVSAFDVNISYQMPEAPGIWQGFLVVNLASGGSIRLDYDYMLQELPPMLEFETPLNLTRTNHSIPITLSAHDFGGGFNLSDLKVNTSTPVDWNNASFTLEVLSERDGPVVDHAYSWQHWNEVTNESAGSHYSAKSGFLAIEVEEPTSTVEKSSATAPDWLELTSSVVGGQTYLSTDSDVGWYANNADDGPRLDYSIDFANNGTYYVWLRLNATDENGSSVHLGIDGSPLTSSGGIHTTTYGSWQWSNMAWDGSQTTQVQFDVNSPGRYTINLWPEEDGVSIDQLVITDSWNYVPSQVENSTAPFVDATLRSAWLNLSLPEDNGWRTFSAELTDVAGRENTSNLMIEYDDIAPPILIYDWKFLSNKSLMPLTIQTDPEADLWLNGTILQLNETGFAETQLTLHPTYWANVDGDPDNSSTWDWIDLNVFHLAAQDPAGNWYHRHFDVVFDGWGANNFGVEKQIILRGFSGNSDNGEWQLSDLSNLESLNAKNTPLVIDIDSHFDTRQVCAYLIDDSGVEWTSSCFVKDSPPWQVNASAHLRAGVPSPPPNIHLPFAVEMNHSGLPDGSWQIFVETLDWAGNWGWENFTLNLDRTAPEITWNWPVQNTTLWNHAVDLSWNLSELAITSLLLDSNIVTDFSAGDLHYSNSISLDETGWHEFCLLATDLTIGPDPNIATNCINVYLNPDAYVPTLSADWNHGIVNSSTVFADLHLGPSQGWSSQIWDGENWVIQNGSELSSGNLTIPIHLTEGENLIRFEVEALERMFLYELDVVLDTRSPNLTISSPKDGIHTSLWGWNVTGECDAGLTLDVVLSDGSSYQVICDIMGNYSVLIDFSEYEGVEAITVNSRDLAGNLATQVRQITIDRQAPRATLTWLNPDCDSQPVETIFNLEPVASCHLELRASFLDPDATYWTITVELDGELIATQIGGVPESDSITIDFSESGRPGSWRAELVVSDAAGNMQTVHLEETLVSEPSAFSVKVSTIGSISNILLLLVLLGVILLIRKMHRERVGKLDEQLPTPLDPELFVDEIEDLDDDWDIDELSMPSSHGPIGAPPTSDDEVAIADATLLQKVKDREIKKTKTSNDEN